MSSTKVIVIGNSGSGKTPVMKALRGTINWEHVHAPTMGVEVHPIRNEASTHIYKMWDCAGKPQFGGLQDGYYLGATMALIFHGGEDHWTSEQWETHVINKVPGIRVHHITGSLQDKHSQVLDILA